MENKKKVVAFVPMKLNNERLPGKNTKAFKGGKPLLTYILDTLTKVEGIDETYVYCSNEEVKKYLPNGIKFLKRSESLDTSSTLIIDVLKAFAEDVDADIYVLAHATAPFIKAKTIETAIDKVKNEEYDSAFTVKPIQEFCGWTVRLATTQIKFRGRRIFKMCLQKQRDFMFTPKSLSKTADESAVILTALR